MRRKHRLLGKRLFDLLVVVPGLIILCPVFLVLAALVRIKLGSPVFFRQSRCGMNGREFTLFKFRSMSDARDELGQLMPDAVRLTPFGRFLRETSLDELPELLNIIRGEMSLVGPRPLLVHYLHRYTPEQNRRHEVLPGLTGWAQIHGRNSLTWEEKFQLDVWYVDNWSLFRDCVILVRTLSKIAKREGINVSSDVAMHEFLGNGTHQ